MSRITRLAKVSTPVLCRVLDRPRLFRRLDSAVRRRALWIVAPPGAGKTALVTSWLARRKRRHLWLQLDEGDGDVATFFRFLSLAGAELSRHRRALPGFTREYLRAPASFARRFFRILGATARPPLAIVLDDYHEVPLGSSVHGALRDGVGELPEGVSLVVLSRSDPPPELARLRALGSLEVIGAESLSLTEAEARAVSRLWGYSGGDRDRLLAAHARTHGWAAGLVLLLAGWKPAEVQAADDRRALFDYFAEEVLARAGPETRRVLLETAVLPTFTAAMAEALTGNSSAGEILAELSRRGYFVERHDRATPTFRVHDLFREFLVSRSDRELPAERRRELRVAAAAQLERAGEVEEAFRLHAHAAAWAEAARLLRSTAPELLRQGREETIIAWAMALPSEERERDPWLLLWLGMARSPIDPARSRADLGRAYDLFRVAGDVPGLYLTWAAVAEGFFEEFDDLKPLDQWLSELWKLRARYPEVDGPEVEARLVRGVFSALVNREPWNPELRVWEERALSLAFSSSADPALRVLVGQGLIVYYGWWAIDLDKARLMMATLRPFILGRRASPATVILWHVASANQQVHLADSRACLKAVESGLAIAAESGLHQWDAVLLQQRALASTLAGDLALAERTLEEIRALRGGGEREPRLSACSYHYAASVVARFSGKPGLAREHAHIALNLAVAAGMPLAEVICRLVLALASSPEESQPELERALELSRRCAFRRGEAASLLAMALAAARHGSDARAGVLLREGLAICRALDARHVFWFLGEELAECCRVALQQGIETSYARDLVRTHRLIPGERAQDLEAWPWALRVEALGGFAVVKDDVPLPPGRKEQKKPMEMLRLLVAHGPRGARAQQLADALWPCADGDAAHHALSTTLYRVRKLLGDPEAVAQQDGRVFLDHRRVFVDAWALERVLDLLESRAHASEGQRRDALRSRARQLYRGELFGADGEEPTLAEARDRLRRRVERCLRTP